MIYTVKPIVVPPQVVQPPINFDQILISNYSKLSFFDLLSNPPLIFQIFEYDNGFYAIWRHIVTFAILILKSIEFSILKDYKIY